MTDSGYPRIARLWRRGTPLDDAVTVFEGEQTDMLVGAVHDDAPGFERNFVFRNIAFYNDELFLRADDGSLEKIDAPNSANKTVFHEYIAVELRDPWQVGGTTYPAGALLAGRFDQFRAGNRQLAMVFEPTETTALAGFGFTKDYLYINVLDDVKNRIVVMRLGEEEWKPEPLVGAPDFGTVNIVAVDAEESNEYFMTNSDYLTPTTLSLGEIGQPPRRLKSLPEFFDAEGLVISQHFAISQDGTRVPYFMVAPESLKPDHSNPTLLYGYGGFEISMQPTYNPGVGRAWTSQGGVYVVANIRGGGEYGPRWHQAALKANRLRAYEDFAAVARDLIARGITSPERLGIQGGSNGGLLVGNMVTQYPELMHAAVCQVPLLDMKRYNHLLAGASWMAEYGNPDLPEEWEFIRTYSPYHNVKKDAQYPAMLLTTSTRDDRVHPGHARKMTARMEELGHDVLYYENIEGGHGGAANNEQAAYMQALAYTFLKQKLFP
jgi:prolyl oligopeptidase